MNLEAEQHLLACAIIDENKVPDLLEIPEEWFFYNQHKLIIRVIKTLSYASLSSDLFAIADSLKQAHQLEMAGGMEYLVELTESLPNLQFWNSYKNSLFGAYKLTQIKQVSDKLQMQIGSGAKPQDMVDYIQTSLIDLMTDHHNGGFKPISSFLDQALEDIQWRMDNEGKMRGIQTGYEQLDEAFDGFESGKPYVIAGRPGMGKTQFALNLALRLSQHKPVCVFSLEMTGKGLSMRAICNESRVYNSKIKSGNMNDTEMNSVAMAVTRLHTNAHLYIDEQAGLSTAQMRSRLKAFKIKHGAIGAIVVDHIGLIRKDPRKGDTESLAAIVHELAQFAKEFDCPMIELAQLNRGVEQRTNKRPLLSDLKQSGAIEEDARGVILLYRDEYYNDQTQDKNITEVDIAKNSDGECKTLYFRHNMAIAHYEEISGYEPTIDESKKMKF